VSAALDSARVWLEQGRHDRAEGELRRALAQDPSNAAAHALLGLTLVALDRAAEAVDEARAAIAAAPESPLAHHAHAAALEHRGQPREARQAIAEAQRLDARNPDTWALLGQIELTDRAWAEALRAANQALAIDPEHVGAINVRARALVQLGRDADADATLAQALRHDPENATTHANLGWALLQRGEVERAQAGFLEALRLAPGHDSARAGLVESIKARNRLYRGMLAYSFWMARQRRRTVWAVLILVWLVPRFLRSVAREYPGAEPFLAPLGIGLALLVLLTWILGPLTDAFLFFHPVGRHALLRREKLGAAAVSACLAGSIVCFATAALARVAPPGALGFVLLLFVLPLSATFGMDNPRRRRHLAIYTSVLAVLGLAGVVLVFVSGPPAGAIPLVLFLLGTLALTWLVNAWQLNPRTD
jgi:tetratricopeptide (TPR) repeat protein